MICHRDFPTFIQVLSSFIYTTISNFPQLSFLYLSNINTHHSILAAISTQYIFKKKKISNKKPSNGVPVLVKILVQNDVAFASRNFRERKKVLNITFNRLLDSHYSAITRHYFLGSTRLEQAATDIRNGNKSKTEHFR